MAPHTVVYSRDLCTYNINPTVRQKLTKAGFRTSADLEGVAVMELTKGKIASVFFLSCPCIFCRGKYEKLMLCKQRRTSHTETR